MAQATIMPWGSLPTCAQKCGVLYDVNGACVPPAAPTAAASVYEACFCKDDRLAGLKNDGGSGVCDAAGCAASDMESIHEWYTNLCATATAVAQTASAATGASSSDSGQGGGWLSTHYQWVIFLIIMVVAIVGIWVGACVWRRHYLRKRDRAYALGTSMAHETASGRIIPHASNAGSIHVPGPGMFQAAPISSAAIYSSRDLRATQSKTNATASSSASNMPQGQQPSETR